MTEFSMKDIPIMIPSKNRGGKTKTDILFSKFDYDYTFVIEPQDVPFYSGKTFVLPENDRGISYSRDKILRHMREKGVEYFWMIDDDILHFGKKIRDKTVNTDASVLESATKMFLKYDHCLYSLEYSQFAWCGEELSRNKVNFICVLFNMKNCQNLNYDTNILIREDFDISLQAILHGKGTLKTAKYFFCASPGHGVTSGGMQNYYKSPEVCKREVEKIVAKYPKICVPYQKDGRWEVKVKWSEIKPRKSK